MKIICVISHSNMPTFSFLVKYHIPTEKELERDLGERLGGKGSGLPPFYPLLAPIQYLRHSTHPTYCPCHKPLESVLHA